jgi:hypothetical protein
MRLAPLLLAAALLLAGCSAPVQTLRLDDASAVAVANVALDQDGGSIIFVDGGSIRVSQAMLTRDSVFYRYAVRQPLSARAVTDVRAVETTGLPPSFVQRRGFILGGVFGFGAATFILGQGDIQQQSATPILGVLGTAAVGAVVGAYVLPQGTRRGTYVVEQAATR